LPERTAHVTELRVNQRGPSLVAELRDGSRARLILVSAPAGAGKTTVLASWRADPAEQRPFAWLSLDSRDNDPVRFWNHVLAALRTGAPDAGAGVDDALRSSGGDVTDLALPLLVNALTSLPGKVAESDPRLCLARAVTVASRTLYAPARDRILASALATVSHQTRTRSARLRRVCL
jgi:ATP/maltotriose-dependent transcriptional regulator MalT